MGAVGSAESVVDEHVRQRGQSLAQLGIVLGLALLKPGVLQQHHVAVVIDIGHRALGLQERVLGPRRFKVPGDHVFGSCDRARRVAAAHMTDGL